MKILNFLSKYDSYRILKKYQSDKSIFPLKVNVEIPSYICASDFSLKEGLAVVLKLNFLWINYPTLKLMK